MDLYIFDKDEVLLYVRSDASEAIYSEQEYQLHANFPIVSEQPIESGQFVGFYDVDNVLQLCEIRKAIPSEPDHTVDITAQYAAFAELSDEIIEDIRPTNDPAGMATAKALNGSRWQLGSAVDTAALSTTFYYISRWAALQSIKNTWGVALRFRWELGSDGTTAARYVDILSRQGAARGKRFELDKDIDSIKVTYDDTGVYTALYGRGKGEVAGTSSTGDPTYTRRLTFADEVWSVAGGDLADKPAGQEWVEDVEATAAYGRMSRPRVGVVVFEDCTDASDLIKRTWDKLQAVKDPVISIEATVQDLEALWGYQHEAVRSGDDVTVIVQPADIEIYASVTGLVRDLIYPEKTKVTIGNYRQDITDMQAQAAKDITLARAVANVGAAIATANPSLLQSTLDTMITKIMSSGTRRYTDPFDGGEVYEADNGSSAMKLTGQGWMIADTKIGDVWQWTTAATGRGIVAEAITVGTIRAAVSFAGQLLAAYGTISDLIAGAVGNNPAKFHMYQDANGDPVFDVFDSGNTLVQKLVKQGHQIGTDIISPYSTPISTGIGIFSL